MNIFCDTSVLLAAAKSSEGASRALFDYAPKTHWTLLGSPWVIGETVHNLAKFDSEASEDWQRLEPKLSVVADVVSLDRALVFPVPKDRPVLYQFPKDFGLNKISHPVGSAGSADRCLFRLG